MASLGYTMEMPTIPRGRSIEASPGWIDMARKRIDELGLDGNRLAALAGVDPASVSRFLRARVSRYANEIADALKLPRPYVLISSEAEAEWWELGHLLRRLDAERQERILTNIRMAVGGSAAASVRAADGAIDAIVEVTKPTKRRT